MRNIKRIGMITLVLLAIVVCLAGQAFAANPYMDMWERIPDGEPRVFVDPETNTQRLYVYGSHDTLASGYCGPDHVVWSAPVDDLTDWRHDGVAFQISQLTGLTFTPEGGTQKTYTASGVLYAPDVVYHPQLNKYYMFVFTATGHHIFVAESTTPNGPFTNPRYVGQGFDPAVLVDDVKDENGNQRVYLYWSNESERSCYACELDPVTMQKIDGTLHVPIAHSSAVNGNGTMPHRRLDPFYFFEGPSIRKVENTYVLTYAKTDAGSGNGKLAEIGYCFSDNPYGDPAMGTAWEFGGVVVDNLGEVIQDPYGSGTTTTYKGGNNHGGMIEVNGQWYQVYHRAVGINVLRQSMAEAIDLYFDDNGKLVIEQAEITSQGFEKDGLNPYETQYAASACFGLGSYTFDTNPSRNFDPIAARDDWYPVTNLKNHSWLGYKYFNFADGVEDGMGLSLKLSLKEYAAGTVNVYAANAKTKYTDPEQARTLIGSAVLAGGNATEHTVEIPVEKLDGTKAIYLEFLSTGGSTICELNKLWFEENEAAFADTICLDGVELEDFNPYTYGYTVMLESLSTLPEVTAKAESGLTVNVTQATKENPVATVTVSSENKTNTYTVTFKKLVLPSSWDFTKTDKETLLSEWEIVNPSSDSSTWSIDETGLHLAVLPGDLYQTTNSAQNVFTLNSPGNWIMDTKVSFNKAPSAKYHQAVIMAFDDVDNYVKLSYEYGVHTMGDKAEKSYVQFAKEIGAVMTQSFQDPTSALDIYYRLKKVGDIYTAYYSLNGETYVEMGSYEASFAEPKVALAAFNGRDFTDDLVATFEYLTYSELPDLELPQKAVIPYTDCTPVGKASFGTGCIEWITTVGSGFTFTYNNETEHYLQAEVGINYASHAGGDKVSILSEEISQFTTTGLGNWSKYQDFDSIGYVTLKPGVNTITFRSDYINGTRNIGYNMTEIRLTNFRKVEDVDFDRTALFTVDDFSVFGNAVKEPNAAPYTNVGYMTKAAGGPDTGLSFTVQNLSDKPVYATVGAKITTSSGGKAITTYAITANDEEPLFDSLFTPINYGTWDVNKYTTVDGMGTVILQPGKNTVYIKANNACAYGMNVKEVYLSDFRESTDLTYDSKLTFGLGDFTLSGKAVFEPASAPHTNVGYMVQDPNASEPKTAITFTYVNWQSTPVYATVGAKLTTNTGGNVCTAYAVTANGQKPLVDSVYMPPNFGTWDVNKYTMVDRIGTVLLQPGENTISIAADTVSAYGMNVQEVYLTEFIPASAAIDRLECMPAELEAYVNENGKLPENFAITVYFADGTSAQIEDYSLTVLDEDLLRLSGETLTGLKEGETALKLYYGAATLTIPVKIIDRTPVIRLDKAQFMTNSGKTVSIAAKTAYLTAPIVWTSDNEAVATVDENGNVTAHSHGDAIITATSGTVLATCRVSVDYEGQNPFLPPSWGLYICDPEPYTIDGRMYLFGSTDHPMGRETDGSYGYCGTEYHVLYTDDMINWTDAGIILTLEDIPAEYRGGSRLWGPGSLFKAAEEGREEKYYFIANTNSYTSGMVLFEADSPTGPFGNPRPMMKDGKVLPNLDPGVLADDDGKVYFAYQYDGYKFAVCQLNPADFSQILSDTVVDVTDVFKAGNPNEWPDEGQSLKKRGDTYYYLNMLNYAPNNSHRIPVKMAYLMADSPLGPWRYGGKIVDTYHYLDSSNIQGGFAELNGQWYVAYHMPTPDSSNARYCWIDPITFNEDGTIRQIEPTSSGAKGSFRVGEKIQSSGGVHFSGGRGDKRIVQRYEGNLSQWWKDDFRFTDYPETWYSAQGQFIGYRYMDFSTLIRKFEITAKTTGDGAVLKVYKGAEKGSANDAPGDGINQPAKDGPTGECVAVVELPNTNGQYRTFTVPATVTEDGIYSFYIVLDTVAAAGNVYVDSMRFLRDYDLEAAEAVDALIAAMVVEDEASVKAARAAFDALTDEQKVLVTKLADLEAAELYWNTVHGTVSLVLTGAETVDAMDGEAVYTLSAKGMNNLASVAVSIAIPADYLAEPVAKAAEGWMIVAQAWKDGKLHVVIVNTKGANGDGDILTVTAKPMEQNGMATLTVTDVEMGAYLGEKETFVQADLTEATVTTEIRSNPCDVNKDGVVDMRDIARAQRYYGQSNADADVNRDGTVDVADLITILNNYTDLFE